MTFNDLKSKYPDREVAFPDDQRKPNKEDLDSIIHKYDCKFPPSFVDFQLEYCLEISIGDLAWDGFGWANKDLDPYMNLEEIVKDYKDCGYPNYLSPFKQDNGDFWCFDSRIQSDEEFPIVIWDHNSNDIEKDENYQWKSFIEWLDSTMEEE